jgi:Zn-dependent alcohol dehydrogenase
MVGAKMASTLRKIVSLLIVRMMPYGTKTDLHGYDFPREQRIQGSSMVSNRLCADMPRLLNAWRKGHLKLNHLISSHIQAGRDQRRLRETQGRRCTAPQLSDFGVAK